MPFHDRKYEVFVILGDAASEPAWTESRWKLISDILDPLVEKCRGRAAVRSTQLRKGAGSPNQRAVSLGRIGWNAQGHKKWVHQSPASDGIVFISAEMWAPSWTTCEQEGIAPDLYVAVHNEQPLPGEQVAFNPVFILAVALDADSQMVANTRSSAEALSTTLNSVLRAHWVRPWGIAISGIVFGGFAATSVISDLHVSGLFKRGPRNQKPPTIEMLDGAWERF